MDCKQPQTLRPVVDRARCEAKADCVRVCPYDVFEVRALGPADKAGLGAFARFRAFVHGNKQAFVVDPGRCHGCGLCVTACPEKAIKLERYNKEAT